MVTLVTWPNRTLLSAPPRNHRALGGLCWGSVKLMRRPSDLDDEAWLTDIDCWFLGNSAFFSTSFYIIISNKATEWLHLWGLQQVGDPAGRLESFGLLLKCVVASVTMLGYATLVLIFVQCVCGALVTRRAAPTCWDFLGDPRFLGFSTILYINTIHIYIYLHMCICKYV